MDTATDDRDCMPVARAAHRIHGALLSIQEIEPVSFLVDGRMPDTMSTWVALTWWSRVAMGGRAFVLLQPIGWTKRLAAVDVPSTAGPSDQDGLILSGILDETCQAGVSLFLRLDADRMVDCSNARFRPERMDGRLVIQGSGDGMQVRKATPGIYYG